MPRKNRGYKKGKPYRDARLFVIIAEGEREDAYFKFFDQKNQRVKVQIVKREQNRSAPNFFLERLKKSIEEGIYAPKENDFVWFVLDVDRWSRQEIEQLNTRCKKENNWHLGISNPCFEIWLLYHFIDKIEDNGEEPKDLKSLLHEVSEIGFDMRKHPLLIETARRNAAQADEALDQHYPKRMQTKLHQLATQMLNLSGNDWKTEIKK